MKKIITIDIHGLTGDEAKRRVEFELRRAPAETEKLVVIHGCNNGTVLRDVIRTRVRSPRITDIVPTFANDGETTFYLKKATR